MITASPVSAFDRHEYTKEQYGMARQTVYEEHHGMAQGKWSMAEQVNSRAIWIARAVQELKEAAAIASKWNKPTTPHVTNR